MSPPGAIASSSGAVRRTFCATGPMRFTFYLRTHRRKNPPAEIHRQVGERSDGTGHGSRPRPRRLHSPLLQERLAPSSPLQHDDQFEIRRRIRGRFNIERCAGPRSTSRSVPAGREAGLSPQNRREEQDESLTLPTRPRTFLADRRYTNYFVSPTLKCGL